MPACAAVLRSAFTLALAFFSSGCAFMNQHVQLDGLEPVTLRSSAPRKVVVRELVDARVDPSRVGVVKNGWGNETAMVLTETDVSKALSEALCASLERAGWTVVRSQASAAVEVPRAEDWVVSGWLRSLMSEPSIGTWAVDELAEAEVTLEVRTAHRLLRRSFRGFELLENNLACFSDCAQQALKAAMTQVVQQAVQGLLELSVRVPPVVLEPAPTLLWLELEVD